MLETLNSLWIGDRLRYMEQLCILSALDLGHPFRLYSYTPEILRGVPTGVDLRDAREIMPIDKLVRDSGTGAVQPGSDIFRYILLTKESGYWVDMDFYFLKPLDFDEDYVFGKMRAPLIMRFYESLPIQTWPAISATCQKRIGVLPGSVPRTHFFTTGGELRKAISNLRICHGPHLGRAW